MDNTILSGIRVIELAGVLAGPSVGMFLAELGAEVIKIENPRVGGDVTRSWRSPQEASGKDITAYFACANWGKKSVAIDLSSQAGKDIVYQLVAQSDIVVSAYKAGDDKKLGMDEESLRKHRQDLIYATISGYGPNDPRIAYDAVLQAESGFMSMNGTPESGPVKMPVALIDILAAHQLKEAILLALIKRMRHGEGSRVDVSLMDSALVSLANQGTNYLFTGKTPGLQGSIHPNIAPYGDTFQTADGKTIILAVGSDRQFADLCRILNMPELSQNPDFSTNEQRVKNRSGLSKVLASAIAKVASAQLLADMQQYHIPGADIRTVKEALENNPRVILQKNNVYGLKQAVFMPNEVSQLQPPPHLGEHTKEVLQYLLHLSAEQVEALRKEKTLQ